LSGAWRVQARNTATTSDNKIHDDAVARSYGFSGGLVPGVDVYAYMTHLPVEKWGIEFLERGRMSGRFHKPVYDGDELDVTFDGHDIELRDSRGVVCATGWASLPGEPIPPADVIDARPLPERRPPATEEAFVARPDLGSLESGFHAEHAPLYLADVGETLELYEQEGVAHPGWLLRTANFVLAANVKLGPWIHVSSVVQHHGLVHDGARVSTRARVAHLFETKGHKFVTLGVAIMANERDAMRVEHTAIYEPRRVSTND